jgi:hypothetical protein
MTNVNKLEPCVGRHFAALVRRDRLRECAPELLSTLKECLELFAKDHAIDHFDWGKSFLRAQDIAELNELPLKIRAVIAKAEGKV